MKNMMRRTVLLVFIFACTVLTEAATVHNTNNAVERRCRCSVKSGIPVPERDNVDMTFAEGQAVALVFCDDCP